MSDPLDAALRQLRGQPTPRPFAEPVEVRRRGRRRTIRQGVVTGVVVLAVFGAAAGALTRGDGWDERPPPGQRSSSPATSTSPSPSASASSGAGSPSAASSSSQPSGSPSSSGSGRQSATGSGTLLPADLGPGQWKATGHELFEGGASYWGGPLCAADSEANHPSYTHQVSHRGVSYVDGDRRVSQAVERYQSGYGARNLTELRAAWQRCSRTTKWPDGVAPSRYTIIDTGFAGDESMLVRIENWVFEGEDLAPTPLVSLAVVLRVGDTVTTVVPPFGSVDEGSARTLGVVAAARLR